MKEDEVLVGKEEGGEVRELEDERITHGVTWKL